MYSIIPLDYGDDSINLSAGFCTDVLYTGTGGTCSFPTLSHRAASVLETLSFSFSSFFFVFVLLLLFSF